MTEHQRAILIDVLEEQGDLDKISLSFDDATKTVRIEIFDIDEQDFYELIG